jgi:MoaA/NifB/PqqE/SkfB family radical SAM enzyme
VNISTIAGLLRVAGRKTEHEGFDKYSLLSLRGVFSPGYNYIFDVDTGEFARWGETLEDDPEWCPFGPEILDLEISEGDCSGRCPWCYKSNPANNGKHMTFATFKKVFDTFPATLTQIALGLTDLDANPDLLDIMRYCLDNDVVPNFTTAGYGATPELVKKTAALAGAVAVSVYPHTRERAYETIRAFQAEGMDQVNIHLLYHDGNMDFVYEVLKDVSEGVVEPRAVVLLGLKPKGRGSNMEPLSPEKFQELVEWAMAAGIPLGFDSCSATKFLRAVDNLGVDEAQREYFHTVAEPCESGLFSIYVSRDAKVYPCSFTEDTVMPIDLLEVDDWVDQVWTHPIMCDWRRELLANNRACPAYEID